MNTMTRYRLVNGSSYWNSTIREIVELSNRKDPMPLSVRAHVDAAKRFLRESPEVYVALKELLDR